MSVPRGKFSVRILVTGGLGVVGTAIVQELESRGQDVWIADLPHHFSEKYYRCDVSSYRQLERIFDLQKFDIVYHLAAEFGRWNGEDFYEMMWRANAVGTKYVLRLQARPGFRQ